MSLTNSEENRIKNIETSLAELDPLVRGSASETMLNELLTLSNDQIRKLETRVTNLTALVNELIALAKNLQ